MAFKIRTVATLWFCYRYGKNWSYFKTRTVMVEATLSSFNSKQWRCFVTLKVRIEATLCFFFSKAGATVWFSYNNDWTLYFYYSKDWSCLKTHTVRTEATLRLIYSKNWSCFKGLTVRTGAISSSGTSSGLNFAGVTQGNRSLTGNRVTITSPFAKKRELDFKLAFPSFVLWNI